MRLDPANRAFVWLLVGGGAAFVLLLMASCAALGVIGYRLAFIVTGSGSVASNLEALAPAAVFAVPVATGIALGVRSVVRQVRATNALKHRVDEMTIPTPARVGDAAGRAGIDQALVVDSDEPYSFAFGLARPRVVISRVLADASSDELDAVLEHERYHVANMDPLKVVMTRTVSASFYYLPVMRDLHRRYVTGRELAADRRAITAHGRRPLAAALFRVASGPRWPELSTAASIGGADVLDVRLEQLETGREPKLSSVTWRARLMSMLAAAVLIWATAATMIEMSNSCPCMQRSAITSFQ